MALWEFKFSLHKYHLSLLHSLQPSVMARHTVSGFIEAADALKDDRADE